MSDREKQRQYAPGPLEARHGTTFWDGVEREVESLEVTDFALFLGADGLAIEPSREFASALSEHLASVFRARWSN